MKIPKAKKLPSGSWNVSVMIDGVRHSITAPTKRAAESEAAAIKSGAKAARSNTTLTVGEAIDLYIDGKDGILSPTTIERYRCARRNSLHDLMPVGINALTPQMVQRSIGAMSREKSAPTVHKAYHLLYMAIRDVREDFKWKSITLPRCEKPTVAIPSDEDISRIMAAIPGHKDELEITLAIWLGLRMSEIRGLQWGDIDGNVLHIRRAKVDNWVKVPKSVSSTRDLPLSPHLIQLFQNTPKTPGSDFVCNKSRRVILARFTRLCEAIGVQHYRFHDLRHINASVMLALGVPNKYAVERMGHSTDKMLRTVYQHTMSAERDSFNNMIDHYFESKLQTDLHTKEKKS